MKPREVVDRARSQIGLKTKYELARGGFHGNYATAADMMGRCDCSGFVAWCLGSDRKINHPAYAAELGQWVETSAIVRDAKRPFGMFLEVLMGDAEPGMVYVWGDGAGHQGHVGIITECEAGNPTKIVHCSKGNYVNLGDAVAETDAAIFEQHHAIIARCVHVEHEAVAA